MLYEINNLKKKFFHLSGHFKLKATDDVFAVIEDNQVKLQTMKASRFVKAFDSDVDKWERNLSLIGECIEMLLTVQRQWMYLEVILKQPYKLKNHNNSIYF